MSFIYCYIIILGEAHETLETTKSFFGDLDDEDRRLFNQEFIRKSIGEADDDDDSLYYEQVHNASQELWDDLLEENILEDLEESNFPGAVQADASESFNRAALINWLLLFICYWWTYFNVADRGIELLLQFFHAFFTVLSERFPWLSLFVVSFPSSLYLLKKHFGLLTDGFQKFVVCPKCNSLYNYDSTFETRGGKQISKRCRTWTFLITDIGLTEKHAMKFF